MSGEAHLQAALTGAAVVLLGRAVTASAGGSQFLAPGPVLGALLGLAALVMLSALRRKNAPAVVLRRQGRATPARSSRRRR